MRFNQNAGKPASIAPEDTWLSHFKWNIFYSFSLVQLIDWCKKSGGVVTNEHDVIVFDSGREYSHQDFQNLFV